MTKRLRSFLAFMLFVCTASIGAHAGALQRQAQALPDIAAPPNGHAYWIARSMRLNGVPMTLKSISSAANADEVLHHYERTLRTSSDLKTRRTNDGPWRVLSVLADDYFITIRARDTSKGSQGTVAVSVPLARATAVTRTRFPHPESSRVVNFQEYDDDGIEAEHISLVSHRSVTIEAREFASLLTAAGWQLIRDSGATDRRGGYVIEAQKAAQLAVIHLQRLERGGETSILIVWRKA